jgi:cupin 2 domain-containing protein
MKTPSTGRALTDLPIPGAEEIFERLAGRDGVTVERIVSHGHHSPEGFWYDQEQSEWVMVLQGRAVLEIEGRDEPLHLEPGDWVDLPAHCRHRVASTDHRQPTVWLAVHY